MEPRRSINKDDKFYQRILDRCSQLLKGDLDPTPLLDTFLSEEILEYTTVRDIQELPLTSAKNSEILRIFRGRGRRGYNQLKHCLKKADQSHLVDTLLKAESELERIIEMEQRQTSEQREVSEMGFIQRVPDDGDLNQIAQCIGMNWEFLGPRLGVKGSQIDQFKLNYPSNVKMQIFKMLQQWRQSGGSEQTMEKLLEFLKSARSYVNMEWEDIKGIAESPPLENRNSDHRRTGDHGRNTVSPIERENDMPSVGNTPDQQREQNMFPVHYAVTQHEQQTPLLKSVEIATHPQGLRPEDLTLKFANTLLVTGENFSNLPQADLSGQSNMPDGPVNSVSAKHDSVDAGREQFVPGEQILYTPKVTQQSSNYEQRQQPVSETPSSHIDNYNQRTKHIPAGTPRDALVQIKEIIDNQLTDNQSPIADTGSPIQQSTRTVTAVPSESVSEVPVDVVDTTQKAIMEEMKIRATTELSQSPYDGRLLTCSVDTIKYIIREPIDTVKSGGFGTVYIHRRILEGLEIPVVVKEITLRAETARCRDKMMSVTNEKLASRTLHFAIVPLLAMTEDINTSTYYFLSPLLEKGSLKEAIETDTAIMTKSKLGDLSEVKLCSKRRLRIIYQVNAALDFLHKPVKGFRGPIIHMDVKTMNIVLDKYYNARLIDFGLAREMNETEVGLTVSSVIGTEGYIATKKYNLLTVRDDLHNLGVVIRELLTGKPAYDGKNQELRKWDKEKVLTHLQLVWYDDKMKKSEVAKGLNDLADLLIKSHKKQQTVDASQLKEDIEAFLPSPLMKWRRTDKDIKCEMCMVNKAEESVSKEILQHDWNCCCKISVCVACMRNSFLNPIICHTCSEEIIPIIGNGWGALVIAGNDVDRPTLAKGFVRDISDVVEVLISKCPLVMGIDERNIQVVKPSNPGKAEKLLGTLEKAVATLQQTGDIHTLLIYFSGHFVPDSGFRLGDKEEFLSVERLKAKMDDIARSYTSTKKSSSHLSDTRFIIFLDCCAGPNLTDKLEDMHIGEETKCTKTELGVEPKIAEEKKSSCEDVQKHVAELPKLKKEQHQCIIQLNSSRYFENTLGTETGSPFAKYFVQALTHRALNTKCKNDKDSPCPKCEMRGPFISIHELHRFISDHMLLDPGNGHPVIHAEQAQRYDTIIAYSVDFHVQLMFRLKDHGKQEFVPLRMYSNIQDLKLHLFQRLMETMKKGVPNFDINNYIPFVESICIEINNGKDSEELDTIPKVMAAWNARRDLAVSLRTDENIHRGMIFKSIPAMDGSGTISYTEVVSGMLKFISTKELKRTDHPLYQSFVLPYKCLDDWIDDLGPEDSVSSSGFKDCLVSVRSCINNNDENVETDDTTELHIIFPKAVSGNVEDFICLELKNLKQITKEEMMADE